MLNKLKELFPSLKEHKLYDGKKDDRLWFSTKEGQFISILERDLSDKNQELLSVFLQPIEDQLFLHDKLDTLWINRILHDKDLPRKTNKPYRFVYFEIENENFDSNMFKNAITEIFQRQVPILWRSRKDGVIVEELNGDLIDYTQIIDVLMSDLYTNIRFYIGQLHGDYDRLREKYERVITNGQLGIRLGKKLVINYIDILPYKLVHSINPSLREELIETTLKDFKDDPETLHMIETFIECNLNVSLTAKKLYLHRNSLQYRIEKFIEQTNIDIREFHHALAVYFALLALKET